MSSTEDHDRTEPSEFDRENFTGRGMDRVEDYRILTGRAEYIDDMEPDGCRHMALLRSVHPRADIIEIDASTAEEHPECDLVLTGADVASEYNPMPTEFPEYEEWPLAVDRTHFAGEPVVAVVSTDRYVAEDLVDAIDVEYDVLDNVTDPHEAREDEVLVHETVGTNIAKHEEYTFGDIERAFAEADHVVDADYSWGRISGVPLETAGAIGQYDPEADTFLIKSNIQMHSLVDANVHETLGYPAADVNLRDPKDIGGSFGTKITIHRYLSLVAIASQQLDGTPVKYIEDRVEHLQGGDSHSTERDHTVRLAVDDDGAIRGLDIEFVNDCGAFPRFPVVQTLKPLSILPGPYEIENVRYAFDLVTTNKTSEAAYRGFGVPSHNYVLEMIVDDAARELDIDPVDLRTRNYISEEQMPYTIPSKNVYDSGDYYEALARISSVVDEERSDGGMLSPEIVEQRRAEGKYRGVRPTVVLEPGVASTNWQDRIASDKRDITIDRDEIAELPEHVKVDVKIDGTVTGYIATDSSGQGHETLFTQLLADEFDVLPSQIEIDYLDSTEVPAEFGSAASRMAVMLSGAAAGAADVLIDNLKELAATEWDCSIDDVDYSGGSVSRVDGSTEFSLAELSKIDQRDGRGLTTVTYDYEHPAQNIEQFEDALLHKMPVFLTTAYSANAPIVEVDIHTGEIEVLKFYTVRDCGTILNPTIVKGQAEGGIAQGVGAALLEEFEYDHETGQPQAVTLFDYVLPSIHNVPDIEMDHTEHPSPFTTTGAKGMGEGGIIDAPASIAASINAAVEELDMTADEIPFTPNRVRDRLRSSE